MLKARFFGTTRNDFSRKQLGMKAIKKMRSRKAFFSKKKADFSPYAPFQPIE